MLRTSTAKLSLLEQQSQYHVHFPRMYHNSMRCYSMVLAQGAQSNDILENDLVSLESWLLLVHLVVLLSK